ncbi:MAG: DUF58 domain-containing protein [Spirochaetales bacterium]
MQKQLTKAQQVLERMDWTVIRRLDGLLQGDYRTFFQGFGLDFADIREYQYGDDVRTLDWNVTARMTVPYVRRYHEDRDITAWFLLDISPSVDFGSPERNKRDVLMECTTVLSRLLTRQGNRVGAILFDGSVPILRPPGRGKSQVLTLIKDIEEYTVTKAVPETDLSVLLQAAASIIRKRSLVFILSDFFSKEGWERPLGLLTLRNEVTAIRLYDPEEENLPEVGILWVEDAESGEQLLIDTTSKNFKKELSRWQALRESHLHAVFRTWGIDLLPLSTRGDLARELLRFSRLRKLRRNLSVRRKI